MVPATCAMRVAVASLVTQISDSVSVVLPRDTWFSIVLPVRPYHSLVMSECCAVFCAATSGRLRSQILDAVAVCQTKT
jgi:hypothetical protein